MGFNKVYKALLEIFPEVDPRALRAVAIEHNKDGDAAAEVVLTEIVPFLKEISRPPSSSSLNSSSPAVADDPNGFILNNDLIETSDSEDEEQNGSSLYAANAGDCDGNHVKVHEGLAGEEVPSENSQEENNTCASTNQDDLAEGIVHARISPDISSGGFDESLDSEIVMAGKTDEGRGNFSTQDKLVPPESPCELVVADMVSSELKYLEPNVSLNTEANKDANRDVHMKDDSSLNTMVTRSNEICRAELLEGLISDARDNKKTLFSAMESVISLMRKVELQEEAAELAEAEAAKGGSAILNTAEELINMLQHAKEENGMRSGEVYGERAVLATEARELQARLFSLSEERDKSLAILDEMHDALLSRLAAAKEKEKIAEKEMLAKEDMARRSLAEQELIMEKVVQESNMLKEMAEENAKLQEFLEGRGHVVDSLQGEISVICQDVRVLREKFDERVPLSKSLSSHQTSCRLASSFYSKSVASGQVDEASDLSGSSERLQISDLLTTTNEQLSAAELPAGANKKALEEEGWEIFENVDYTWKDSSSI
ncbi:hypothetical protein LIER_31574 [Lithospermum erythrorhizon]|uniref:CUE domain-containing protein n=1 Tax=Lithospermum erythrorhizon TaxID=34254 RepID=A0AAV3RXB1_LITER